MERQVNIEEIRYFFKAVNKQVEEGGVFIDRVKFHRDEYGNVTQILIDYEQRDTKQKENKLK